MGCALLKDNVASGMRYDGLDHLTSADYPQGTNLQDETFQYDKVGNRENPNDLTEYDYNSNHQLIKSPGVAANYFDQDGNLLYKMSGYLYTYNRDNRLTTFTDFNSAVNNATYHYDPFGRRISKTVNGIKTFFVWDDTKIIAEYDGSGSRAKRYAYFPDDLTPIQMEDSNGIYNAHYDHLKTPKFLTDGSQNVVWIQIQKAFGEMAVDENPDGDASPITYNVRFPGQYYDQENGLHYNFYRDTYDPELGRYLQSDPIGLVGGINTYSYANLNPIKLLDYLGLEPSCDDDECKKQCGKIRDDALDSLYDFYLKELQGCEPVQKGKVPRPGAAQAIMWLQSLPALAAPLQASLPRPAQARSSLPKNPARQGVVSLLPGIVMSSPSFFFSTVWAGLSGWLLAQPTSKPKPKNKQGTATPPQRIDTTDRATRGPRSRHWQLPTAA